MYAVLNKSPTMMYLATTTTTTTKRGGGGNWLGKKKKSGVGGVGGGVLEGRDKIGPPADLYQGRDAGSSWL